MEEANKAIQTDRHMAAEAKAAEHAMRDFLKVLNVIRLGKRWRKKTRKPIVIYGTSTGLLVVGPLHCPSRPASPLLSFMLLGSAQRPESQRRDGRSLSDKRCALSWAQMTSRQHHVRPNISEGHRAPVVGVTAVDPRSAVVSVDRATEVRIWSFVPPQLLPQVLKTRSLAGLLVPMTKLKWVPMDALSCLPLPFFFVSSSSPSLPSFSFSSLRLFYDSPLGNLIAAPLMQPESDPGHHHRV